jgi:hypothetical protein
MASSIQVVGSKFASFNDLDLLALLCLLVEEIEANPTAYGTVAPIVTEWHRQSATYGPGTIELGLDEIQPSDSARSELIASLEAVGQRAVRWGERIPESVLNRRCVAPGVRFVDFPVSAILDAGQKLQCLVSEQK